MVDVWFVGVDLLEVWEKQVGVAMGVYYEGDDRGGCALRKDRLVEVCGLLNDVVLGGVKGTMLVDGRERHRSRLS